MPNAPSFSPVIKDLTYIHEENLTKSEFGGSEFGGYPSLRQRSDSYDIRESMTVHCGYGVFLLGQFSMNTLDYIHLFYLKKFLYVLSN